jgi:hypothetical protein
MKRTHLFGAVALALVGAASLPAQDMASSANTTDSAKVTTTDKAEASKAKKLSTAPEIPSSISGRRTSAASTCSRHRSVTRYRSKGSS